MTNYANGDTGSDRAYDYEQVVRDIATENKNEWIRENGPFETEEEADEAYYMAVAEWREETYREEMRYQRVSARDLAEPGSLMDTYGIAYNRESYFR